MTVFPYKFLIPPLENLGLGHEMFHDKRWPDLFALVLAAPEPGWSCTDPVPKLQGCMIIPD